MPSDVMVWDLETIPDIAGFARAKGLVGQSPNEMLCPPRGATANPARQQLSPRARPTLLAYRLLRPSRNHHQPVPWCS
jgi:hypothetical protein